MMNRIILLAISMLPLAAIAQAERRVHSIKEYLSYSPEKYEFDVFTYDEDGRIVREDVERVDPTGQLSEKVVKEYVYDFDNNQIRFILHRYVDSEHPSTKEAYYKLSDGRVVETDFSYLGVEDMGKYIATFTYDESGRPTCFEEKNKDSAIDDFYYCYRYSWQDDYVVLDVLQRIYGNDNNSKMTIYPSDIKGHGILKYWPFLSAGWVSATPFGYWPYINRTLGYMPGLYKAEYYDDNGNLVNQGRMMYVYEADGDGYVVKIVQYGTFVYEIDWEEDTRIGAVNCDSNRCADQCYTLSGQRLAAPRRGVNIVGGKKVIK